MATKRVTYRGVDFQVGRSSGRHTKSSYSFNVGPTIKNMTPRQLLTSRSYAGGGISEYGSYIGIKEKNIGSKHINTRNVKGALVGGVVLGTGYMGYRAAMRAKARRANANPRGGQLSAAQRMQRRNAARAPRKGRTASSVRSGRRVAGRR